MIKVDEFLAAYIEAALWSSNDESTPQGGEPFDSNYSEADLAPETVEKMKADCIAFIEKNSARLERAAKCGDYASNGEYSLEDRAGHDFWLTRNRQGVGFWDRRLGDVGTALTNAAQRFPECNLYLGDDKKIYLA